MKKKRIKNHSTPRLLKQTIPIILFLIFGTTGKITAQVDSSKTDSVLLFLTPEQANDTSYSHRMVGEQYLQITNFAGKTISVKLSADLKKWAVFDIKSPEKKVFKAPMNVSQFYLIIDPAHPKPVRTVIKRNEKYELFFNNSTQKFDIMKAQ